MNEPNALLPIEPTAQPEAPEALYALLAERISRYTMGDSSSVPLDTATRLLEGIVFCVSLQRKANFSGAQKQAPLKERFFAGVAEAKRLTRRGRFLLGEAKRWQPPVVNLGFRGTLAALPSFFKQYDADFFAQEIPCSIDYPLCQPVSDSLLGVEYMLDYLKRWLVESAFLRAFVGETLIDLYERYYGDYDDLLVNLYLPAAEMAILCALAKAPIQSLQLSERQRADALRKLCAADEATARKTICAAAAGVCEECRGTSAFAREYLEATALDLLVRLRAIQPKDIH